MRADRSHAPVRGGESVFNVTQHRTRFFHYNWISLLLGNKVKTRFPLRSLAISFVCLLFLTLVLSAQLKQESPQASPILGFSPSHAIAEHALESTFQSIPSPERALQWHRTFTAEPHPAASERNNQLA